MILKNWAFPVLFGLAWLPATANATKTVTSPYVNKGAFVEWRGGFETDPDDEDIARSRNQIGYGFTDFYELRFSVDTRNDEQGLFSDFDIENKIEILPKGEYFLDLGLRLDYQHALNSGPDEVGTKILIGKQIGAVSQLLNLEAGREIGEDRSDDWAYGIAYGAAYALAEDFSVGGEWYSDFGDFGRDFEDQDHSVGPVVYGIAFDRVKYQAGVLAGVSKAAPDATLKAVVNYGF